MRTCKVCGQIKDESDFYGKAYTCKRCVCKINSERVYKRNLEKEPDITGEIWKPYKNDTRYLVSSIGRIRGLHGQLLSPVEHRQGYLRVKMGAHSPLVHRIVAETFLSNPDNKSTVNHINGIKSDNRIENIEWATQSENNMHAVNTGLRKYTLRQWECQTRGRKLSKHQVNQIKSEYFNGKTQAEIADIFSRFKSSGMQNSQQQITKLNISNQITKAMFGIKIITAKRYNHLVSVEKNFELEKQRLLDQLDHIEKDLDSLREQLSEKMMENNKLYDQVRELVSIKPSFRKSTTKSRKKEP